jgi:D-alanine transaminase
MRELANVNGTICALGDAVIPAEDRGCLFGDGVYEVIRAYQGRLWGFHRHWKRFQRSLKEIDLQPANLDDIRGWIEETYRASQIPDATVYFHLTRGAGPRSHSWGEALRPSFFMSVRPFVERGIAEGVKVQSVPDLRWRRCDIKSLNLLPNVLAKQQARKLGAYEALLVNAQGNVTEGSSSAAMAILNRTIVAPPQVSSILPSITREYVEEIAIMLKLEFHQRWFTLAEFRSASEAFLAGTSDEIAGITHLDGQAVGTGEVGPRTREILKAYRQRIQRQND